MHLLSCKFKVSANRNKTKGEIWEAYTALLRELKDRPVATSDDPVKLQKMAANLTEAKTSLIGHFEATIERLSVIHSNRSAQTLPTA